MDAIGRFIPPEATPVLPVLARFLTPLPANVAAAYIAAYTQEGDLVINPFCRSASVAQVAARLGRPALLSDFNPVITFAARGSLSKVPVRDLAAAFHRLAEAPKGDSSLRHHLLQLYATSCPQCREPVIAQHFVWSRELDQPVQKAYHCTHCGQPRLEPVDPQDLGLLHKIDGKGFHYWAILDRLSPPDEETRGLALRLLDLYTPRNLYALGTLAVKIEALFGDASLLEAFRLMLLECLDRGSKLTPAVKGQAWRTTLRPPAQFLEVNVWQAFEESYQAVVAYRQSAAADSIPLRVVAAVNDLFAWQAARCRGHGGPVPVVVRRISSRRLGAELPPASVRLLLAEPPSLAQADFLALAYLWSGWLLGKEAARAFSPDHLLHPRHANDWPWYLHAMTTTLQSLMRALGPEGHVVLVFVEGILERVCALALAAAAAGLGLEHLVYRPLPTANLLGAPRYGGSRGHYCLCFGKTAEVESQAPCAAPEVLADQVQAASVEAARDILMARGEPCLFTWLHGAICLRLAQAGLLREIACVQAPGFSPLDFLRQNVRAALEKALEQGVLRLVGTGLAGHDAKADVQWWLGGSSFGEAPLSDRVEEVAYSLLGGPGPLSPSEIAQAIHARFPGLLTPEPGVIEATVESYSEPEAKGGLEEGDGAALRRLRTVDQRTRRAQEHLGLVCLLADLGHEMGFRVWISPSEQGSGTPQGTAAGLLTREERRTEPLLLLDEGNVGKEVDVVWYGQGDTAYVFEVEWTAGLHRPLCQRRVAGKGMCRYLVIPEERVDLARFKLARSLVFQQIMAEDSWEFIKYDHLRQFAASHAGMEGLRRIAGLSAPVERFGVQLTLL